MKKLIITMISSLLILYLSLSVLGQSLEIIEKYSKVRITIQDKVDLKELKQEGLALEGLKLEEQSVEVILSESEIIKLNSLGFSYQILIDDMAKYYQERSIRTGNEMKNLERQMKKKYLSGGFGFGSMGGFYTYDEVVAELDTMRMLYPNLITEKYSIGTTLEGRTIWAVKISDNPGINENEPELFYNALVHGREPAGMMALIYFMYNLLENYGSDPEITYLVDNREFYIVPVINPDGYVYNQQTNPNGGGMWRKNRRDVGGTVYGVDLCRNYDYMWGYNNIGSSPNPPDETYRGTAPFSEPETQAIRDFCVDYNFLICNNFHSYAAVVYAPWGYNLTQTPDSTIFNHTIGLATQFNNYENWIYYLGIYERNGDHLDWQYGEQTTKPKIFAYLPEVGYDNDGFWPIPERIFPLAEENVYLNKVLAWGQGVIDNPPHIYEANAYPSYCRPQEDSVHIFAIESNPENFISTVTAYLYDSEDNLLEEFELNEVNTNTYFNSRLSPQDEDFYYFLLLDKSSQLPSNFYYKQGLKYTTAGPVVLDSISWTQLSTFFYSVKPFIKNQSTVTTITNASVRLICNDPWVISITPTSRTLSNIPPGAVVSPSNGFTVRVDPSIFPDYFNFKVDVMKDEWTYWTDSMLVETTFQLIVSVANGWNMVSIPGKNPVNQNINTWWPFRDQGADVFKYTGGYQSVNTVTPGTGYWMKHLGARTYNTGDEWPAIQVVPHNPISGNIGWNLIGGYEDIVAIANMTTTPPNQITGPVYKYSGGYQVAATLDPGYGYWIKLLSACQINIPDALAKVSGEIVEWFKKDWGRIILTDATGISYTLYAVAGEVDLSQYELPPAPMAGMFDIRYSSGRIAEDLNSAIKTIEMSGVTYPLAVRVEGMDIRLMDETGKTVNVNLKSGEDVIISDATIQKLMVTGELIPAQYALEQNYPNPFNPNTTIRFSIAKEVQVNLSVFNILGERVDDLKNEIMKPGYYNVEFDASTLASGIYLYRIKAGDFIQTKKMILLK